MKKNIIRKLEYHYRAFDKSRLSPDPLEFLHRYRTDSDIEITGFISSVFAYGNVKSIINSLEYLNNIMDNNPAGFISGFGSSQAHRLRGFSYRFYTESDIVALFKILKIVYSYYGSLKALFLLYYMEEEKNLKYPVSCFSNNMMHIAESQLKIKITGGLKFMFPDPLKGSACKRMNLFLRWMIRKDELDFGLWNEISPSKLVIPVDTHIARICRQLNLTRSRTVSWRMAEAITDKLRILDPADPVKYDFALCHIGIRKMSF